MLNVLYITYLFHTYENLFDSLDFLIFIPQKLLIIHDFSLYSVAHEARSAPPAGNRRLPDSNGS